MSIGRRRFGGGISDFTISAAGTAISLADAATVIFFNALAGGAQYTDLTGTSGGAITSVTSDANGEIPEFYGPPGVWKMAADANGGSGPRRWITASDAGDELTLLDAEVTALQASGGGDPLLTTDASGNTVAVVGSAAVQALLGYSPSPGPGNLAISIAAAPGQDTSGNAYPGGLTATSGSLSGMAIGASVFQGAALRLDPGGLFLYQPVTYPVAAPPPAVTPYVAGGATQSGGVSTTVTVTTAVATAAGDAVWVACDTASTSTTTVTGVTDSAGNTYTQRLSDTAVIPASLWAATGATTAIPAAGTVTVTFSSATGAKCVSVCGVPGLQASPLDAASTTADGTSGSPSVTMGAPSQPAEVALAVCASANGGGQFTWAAGWQPLDTQQSGSGQFLNTAYQIISTTSALTASGTLAASAKWAMLLAGLKE